jgi:hypothetical protein
MFFHGSDTPWKIGAIIVARPRKTEFSTGRVFNLCGHKGSNVETFFESYRPKGVHARLQGIFMVRDPRLLNLAGGSERYVYQVSPYKPQRHHWGWFSAALWLRARGNSKRCLRLAAQCARAYWSGKSPPESRIIKSWFDQSDGSPFFGTWEWISPRVKVVTRWSYDRRQDEWYRTGERGRRL